MAFVPNPGTITPTPKKKKNAIQDVLGFLGSQGEQVVNTIGHVGSLGAVGGPGEQQLGGPGEASPAKLSNILSPMALNAIGTETGGVGAPGSPSSGSSSSGSPSSDPTGSIFDQALSGPYNLASGYDANKIKQFLTSPYGKTIIGKSGAFNLNNQSDVNSALSALVQSGALQPSYSSGQSGGGMDPLQMQMMYSSVIQPYLQQLNTAASQGLNTYNNQISNINSEVPGMSPNVQGLLKGYQATEDQGMKTFDQAMQNQMLTAPINSTIIDALRANYINGLNQLTTGGTSTTPAHITAPSTAAQINTAINPKLKAGG